MFKEIQKATDSDFEVSFRRDERHLDHIIVEVTDFGRSVPNRYASACKHKDLEFAGKLIEFATDDLLREREDYCKKPRVDFTPEQVALLIEDNASLKAKLDEISIHLKNFKRVMKL